MKGGGGWRGVKGLPTEEDDGRVEESGQRAKYDKELVKFTHVRIRITALLRDTRLSGPTPRIKNFGHGYL